MLKEEIFVALIQYWTRKVVTSQSLLCICGILRYDAFLFFLVFFLSRSSA